MKRIQSKYYKIGSYKTDKTSLSPYSDKKIILKDEYGRLLHFHKSTR